MPLILPQKLDTGTFANQERPITYLSKARPRMSGKWRLPDARLSFSLAFIRWRSIQSRHRSATRAVGNASMGTPSLRRLSTAIADWRFVKAVFPLGLRLAWNGSATVSDGVAALSRAAFV